MRTRCCVGFVRFIASLWLVGSGLCPAAAQLLGPEFQVNTYTTDWQFSSAVAADDAGNFFVTWSSRPQDGSGWGIFARRFDSAGLPAGNEFRVNTYTSGYQRYSSVAAAGSGSFVVVWESKLQDGSGYGVFGRVINPSPPAPVEFRANNYTLHDQRAPVVGATGPGTFVVVWKSWAQDGSNYGLFGQLFMSPGSPIGGEFRVNTYTTGNQRYPAVAGDGAGNFVVVWQSGYFSQGVSYKVFGQRFDSAGTKVGSEFQVNTYTTNSQGLPAVAVDGSGNFVVVWSSYQDGSNDGVFGQRFDSAGVPMGSEFQVNSYTTNSQSSPAVAADGAGNFVVVWRSLFQDEFYGGVFGQWFDGAGVPMGGEFEVSSYTTSNQEFPTVAADGSGNFVVVWDSSDQDGDSGGVFGQRLSAALFGDGFAAGDACAWSAAVGGGC